MLGLAAPKGLLRLRRMELVRRLVGVMAAGVRVRGGGGGRVRVGVRGAAEEVGRHGEGTKILSRCSEEARRAEAGRR